jgi:hypothetical protein
MPNIILRMKHASPEFILLHFILPIVLGYAVLYPARLGLSQKSACRLITLFLVVSIVYHAKDLY